MPELYFIPLATILLTGVIRGLYASVRQAYGYSNNFLFGDPDNASVPGLLPDTAIQSGVVMFLGLWLLVVTKRWISMKEQPQVQLNAPIIAFSGFLCLGQICIRSLLVSLMSSLGIVISDGMLGLVLGLFRNENLIISSFTPLSS